MMNLIRAFKHEVTTNSVRKVGLPQFDDKRYVLEDKISTLAYWHYIVEFLQNNSIRLASYMTNQNANYNRKKVYKEMKTYQNLIYRTASDYAG